VICLYHCNLIEYILCTQSGNNNTVKSRYDEDQIKCQIRKKVEHDFYEYWELDENDVFRVNFFISFTTIYPTYMKLKQSKNEKELGKADKEFAENKLKKKIEIRRNMHKYRDEK
jgi:hypothetical protein